MPAHNPDVLKCETEPAGRPGAACLFPAAPASPPVSSLAACRIVGLMTAEMLALAGDRGLLRRDRRRVACHVRQIAMYVCHVVLRLPQAEVGQAFGRDRTTVGHACNVVEDRRDDRDFDAFVTALERVTGAVFTPEGGPDHG